MAIIGLRGRRPGVSILPASFSASSSVKCAGCRIDEQDAVSEMWLRGLNTMSKGHWQNAFVRRCSPGKASIIEAKRGWKCR